MSDTDLRDQINVRCQDCEAVMAVMGTDEDGTVTLMPGGECDKDHLFTAAGTLVLRCPGCGRLLEIVQ